MLKRMSEKEQYWKWQEAGQSPNPTTMTDLLKQILILSDTLLFHQLTISAEQPAIAHRQFDYRKTLCMLQTNY